MKNKELMRERLISFRREPSTVRIERPTNISTARRLGYKPKKGVIIVRQKVPKGARKKARPVGGRRPARAAQIKTPKKNYQAIAEERANRCYKNCEVLGSYFVVDDGRNSWYEVILLDRNSPEVLADKKMMDVVSRKGRVYRGLTSAGRRYRGLLNKGRGKEKNRPGIRAKKRLH